MGQPLWVSCMSLNQGRFFVILAPCHIFTRPLLRRPYLGLENRNLLGLPYMKFRRMSTIPQSKNTPKTNVSSTDVNNVSKTNNSNTQKAYKVVSVTCAALLFGPPIVIFLIFCFLIIVAIPAHILEFSYGMWCCIVAKLIVMCSGTYDRSDIESIQRYLENMMPFSKWVVTIRYLLYMDND